MIVLLAILALADAFTLLQSFNGDGDAVYDDAQPTISTWNEPTNDLFLIDTDKVKALSRDRRHSRLKFVCGGLDKATQNRASYCHKSVIRVASSPFLKQNQTPSSLEDVLDLYGLSEMQQNAFWLFRVCPHVNVDRKFSREWQLRRRRSLFTNARSLNEYLSEENLRRKRWIKRSVQFIWLNYSKFAFGAPEIDPRDASVSKGEWNQEPMFILDNLDVLWMSRLHVEFWDSVRWLEVAAIVEEAANAQTRYMTFRNGFYADQPQLQAQCAATELQPIISEWLQSPTPDDVVRCEAVLAEILDKCLPVAADIEIARMRPASHHLRAMRSFWSSLPTFQSTASVSFFEVTIRALGGLLSAFTLSGHPVLLYKGWDVGYRLCHGFWQCHFPDKPSGNFSAHNVTSACVTSLPNAPCLPSRTTNLGGWELMVSNHGTTQVHSTAAVVGTNQLEFQTLTDYTGICEFSYASNQLLHWLVDKAMMTETGLMPIHIAQNRNKHGMADAQFGNHFSIGAEADSFYEYIAKSNFQLNHSDVRRERVVDVLLRTVETFVERHPDLHHSAEFDRLVRAVPHPAGQEHWTDGGTVKLSAVNPFTTLRDLILHVQGNQTVMESVPSHTHLGCFLGGFLHLLTFHRPDEEDLNSRIANSAKGVINGCAAMYLSSKIGLASESYVVSRSNPNPTSKTIGSLIPKNKRSLLRPETLESLAWAFHSTHNQRYRNIGWQIIDAMLANGRVAHGFCSVDDSTQARPTYKHCRQDTWILAETLKYAQLLFSEPNEFSRRLFRNESEIGELQRRGRKAASITRAKSGTEVCPTSVKHLSNYLFPGNDWIQHRFSSLGNFSVVNRPWRFNPLEGSHANFLEAPEYLSSKLSEVLWTAPYTLSTEGHVMPPADLKLCKQ